MYLLKLNTLKEKYLEEDLRVSSKFEEYLLRKDSGESLMYVGTSHRRQKVLNTKTNASW